MGLWRSLAAPRAAVDAYDDDAEGELAKNAGGKLAMTRVVLRPRVRFSGPVDADTLARLHASAHAGCFIASSVRTDVRIEPTAA
jgi:organic hydroperoxide reductase OsmC/OhrA